MSRNGETSETTFFGKSPDYNLPPGAMSRSPISRRDVIKLGLGFLAGGILAARPSIVHAIEGFQTEVKPCLISPGGYPAPEFGYNWDRNGWMGLYGLHKAQDFSADKPFTVKSVIGGTIVNVELNNKDAGGILIVQIDPPFDVDQYRVTYAHMDSNDSQFKALRSGMHISQGIELGKANGSGRLSSGVHLHLALEHMVTIPNGAYIEYLDPMKFIQDACAVRLPKKHKENEPIVVIKSTTKR